MGSEPVMGSKMGRRRPFLALADIEGGNARGCGEGDIPMGHAASTLLGKLKLNSQTRQNRQASSIWYRIYAKLYMFCYFNCSLNHCFTNS